jgi:glucan phosphoethanolaminetransferase (alkaline phosphatase superfamily)
VFDERCKAKSFTRASSQSFTVPAFLWASEKAKTQLGDRLASLSASRTHPKISSALPQTLLDLIGITSPDEARTPSWFDEKILPRRVYSKGGWADFDVAAARNPCEISP